MDKDVVNDPLLDKVVESEGEVKECDERVPDGKAAGWLPWVVCGLPTPP